MITLDNYEGYLMRYADGELGKEECAMVEAFLDAHPDIKEELEAITDPSLKISPPLVSMPGKEALLKPVAGKTDISNKNKRIGQVVWLRIAAVVALLMAFGIMLRTGHHIEGPLTALNEIGIHAPVADTPLPDSLYIGRGKPAPIYLAKRESLNTHEGKKVNKATVGKDVATIEVATMEVDNPSVGMEVATIEMGTISMDNVSKDIPSTGTQIATNDMASMKIGTMMVAKVIETDQLVLLTPKPKDRHDMRVGSVIENNNIALAEEKSPIGKAFDAVTRFLLRRTDSENEQCLAFSE